MDATIFGTIASLGPGVAKGPDAGAGSGSLVNFYPYPMKVKDIVFDWDWTVPSRGVQQTYGAPLGDAIRIRAGYRNHPLTNGYVPVNLLGRTRNWQASTPSFIQAAQTVHSTFVWEFPTPMWLPPNVPLTISALHQNDFAVQSAATSTLSLDITIRGELDEVGIIPRYIDIPYASAFLGAVQSTVGPPTGVAPPVTERSGQSDLYNPFDVPLSVERLSYEISLSSHGKDGATNANFAPTDSTSAQDQTAQILAGQNYGLDRRYVTMKLAAAVGRALIKDLIPIGAVLSANDRSLDLRTVLDPKQFYIATIVSQFPTFTDRGSQPFQMRTGVSIIGSRRLTLAESAITY